MDLDEFIQLVKEQQGVDLSGVLTTADKIKPPPENPYRAFEDRNPLAGGGMLVKPSADGSRPGYAKDEYSRIMALGVDKLKELGFTGKKTKKVKAPGSGKPYSKLTDEFKAWVREQTAASPDYRRKDIQFKTRELRVINAIENAFNQNDVRHIITKDKFNKVGSFKASDYPIITAMKKDPEKLKSISAQTNIPEDDLLNLLEDRDVFIKNKYNDVRNLSVAERTKPKKKFYASAEKWILRNSKRYADPDKFYNAFIRTFGEDNHFIKSIQSGKKTGFKVAFSDKFVKDVLGLKSQTSVNPKQLKDIFKTSIYTNNTNVRQKIVDTLTDIIPTNIKFAKDYDVRNALLENPLLKKFGLNQSIKGPIAKLLASDLIDITLKDISSFRKPFLGTRQLLSYLSNRVDPKYRSMFQEATQAVIYAQNNQWKDAKAALNLSQKIMFDHKIPQALIKLGYADDLDYIKLTPTSEDFNTKVKLKQFDQPMITLANEFSKPTTSLDRKAEIVQQMKILQTNFNSKYGNYLGSIDINYDNKTGKLKLTNVDPVVTKKTDFVSSLGKSLTQTGEIDKKQLQNLLKQLEAGNIKGVENALKQTGIKGSNAGFISRELLESAAKGIASVGRVLSKYGILPEAGFLGADYLIRTQLGDSPKEAFLRTTDFARPGDQTKEAEILETSRFFGDKAGQLVGRVIDYEKQLAKIENLKQQKQSLENLTPTSDFSYLPDTSQGIKNIDDLIKQATLDLNNKFNMTEAERIYANRLRDETDDARMATSDVAKTRLERSQSPNYRMSAPQAMKDMRSQMDLNLDMLPTMPRNFMESKFSEILDQTQKLKALGYDVSSKDIMEERDRLKNLSMEDLAQTYSPEQIYGTQGTFFGQPLAGGGIAKIAGVDQGPPPESGPNSQGLKGILKRAMKIKE